MKCKEFKKYKSRFTEEIYINTRQKAFTVLTHFCDYCRKDSIGRYHCPYVDTKDCETTKNEILNDWFKEKNDTNDM